MSAPSTSSNHDPCTIWEEYHPEDTLYLTPGKDVAFYHGLLIQDQSRLFEPHGFEFEILRLLYDDKKSNYATIKIETITNMDNLFKQLCSQRNYLTGNN